LDLWLFNEVKMPYVKPEIIEIVETAALYLRDSLPRVSSIHRCCIMVEKPEWGLLRWGPGKPEEPRDIVSGSRGGLFFDSYGGPFIRKAADGFDSLLC
jgi:hypothetical protein